MGIFAKRNRLFAFVVGVLATASFAYLILSEIHNPGMLVAYNHSDESWFYKMQHVHQNKRHQRLQHVCLLRTSSTLSRALDVKALSHIIVDDRHKLLYCYVPKIACTNWKRVMLVLSKNLDRSPLDVPASALHTSDLFQTLDKYSSSEIDFRLKNYLKFIFVRHPLERLVSAFRNKFEKNYSTYFHNRFGRLIIQHYRTNPSEISLAQGNDVTFNEFIQYLLDPATRRAGPLNEHWRPIHELCLPCKIQYDIVGKYEHLEQDANYVLRAANVSHMVTFPKLAKNSDTSHVMKDYFRNITTEMLMNVTMMYALDFELFGYHFLNLPFN